MTLATIAALGSPGVAAAQAITEFPLPTASSAPQGMAAGPDGALWFTEYVQAVPGNLASVSASRIGRITTSGTITEFPLSSAGSAPYSIAAGPDGALWFVEVAAARIGRIATNGDITEYPISLPAGTVAELGAITAGSDGALWFVAGYSTLMAVTVPPAVIGRITTDGAVTFFTIEDGAIPKGIAAGPDGALWITASINMGVHAPIVDRLTISGVGTSFTVGAVALELPDGIAAGPDGALWFTEFESLGRMTTDGVYSNSNTLFSTETSGGPNGIAAGPDGALWFIRLEQDTNGSYDTIGRMSTGEASSEFPLPSKMTDVQSIVAGPDGAMWFTETNVGKIGRITVPVSTSPLVAAVLPSSRSVEAGATATAFATIINAGTSPATSCAIVPVTGAPENFLYQTTIASDNALTGTPNTPVSIPAGGSQSFFIALTTTAPFVPIDTVLGFDCAGLDAAESVSGLNTLLLSASTTPVPDIIALSATPSGDGILDIAGNTGSAALALASANVGATGSITAAADTDAQALPVALTMCQTDPQNGQCLAPPASSVATTIDANATPTFAVFATASGPIAFAPQTSRIFVRFTDADGATRGLTSVALRTQ